MASRTAPTITRRQPGWRDTRRSGAGAVSNVLLASLLLAVILAGKTDDRSARCSLATFSCGLIEIPSCVGGAGVLCGPHAATHVPLALVVTQRRQAFWQSFRSLVRSTVSSTHVPPPCSGGRPAKGGPVR